ncbi:MAG TPA: hypothetical protein VMU13_01435 [Candidatus Paceibacterota bacterium]|nr:hypothetical protein [Candidatus Paceibacterota bacterium]
MKRSRILAILAAWLSLPSIVLAATAGSLGALAHTVAVILNAGAALLLTATFVVFFYNVVGNIFKMSRGEANGDDLKKNLLWGIIIIFFMVSIWGIIQIVQNSLFGGASPSSSSGVTIYNN